MRSVFYDIHGVLRARVRGFSAFTLAAFNDYHGFFAAEDGGEEPDLDVSIGPFLPDLSECRNLDHKYYVKRGHVYYRDTDKGLRWEVEISGLDGDSGPVRVRYHAPMSNRLKFPWCFFPEMVLNLYVLNPLLDLLFRRKGHYLLHAAGVEKDGRACLIAGRGGAHKTTFVMQLMRRGWNVLGDDMVLLRDAAVLAYPTVAEQLEYLHGHCETEAMDLGKKLGLFRFLAMGEGRGLPVTIEAKAACVNLVFVRDCAAPALREGWDAESLVSSLAVNHLMERNTYVGFKFSTAAFLDAYAFVFPEAGLQRYPADLAEALRRGLSGLPFRVLEIPRRWDARALDLLLL